MVFRVSPAALLIACSSCDAAGLLGNDDDRHSSDQHQKQMSLGQKLDKILGLDSYSSATMEKILADINKNKNKQCCGTCTSTTASSSSSSIVGLSQQDDKKDENRNPEEEDLSNRNDNIMDTDTDTPRDSPLTSDVAMILQDLQQQEHEALSSFKGDEPDQNNEPPKNGVPVSVSVSSSCKTIALDVPREQMLLAAQSLSSVGELDRTMTMDELSAAWLKDALSSLKEFVDHNNDQQQQMTQQKETPPRTELPMPKNLVARGGTESAEVELVPPPIVTSEQPDVGAADTDTGTRRSSSPMLLPPPVASLYATPIRTNKAIKLSSAAADVSPASVTISSFATDTNTTEQSSSHVIVEVPPPAPVRLSVNKAPFMPSPGGSPPATFSDNVFDPFAVAVVSPTEGPPAAAREQWKDDKDKDDKNPPKFSVDLFETGEI